MKSKKTILFQGDSITDCGRNYLSKSSLGQGYVSLINQELQQRFPQKYNVYNRGISGNRVSDLIKRWDRDCLKIQPDILTILIGINDTWRRYDRNDPTTTEAFCDGYRYLLDQVKAKTSAVIVLMEPFVLPFPEDRKLWREDLDPKIEVVHKLSVEYDTDLIPLDRIFSEILQDKSPAFWAADGVHPTSAGHEIIARHWIEGAGEML